MNKLILIGIIGLFLFSGCASVIQKDTLMLTSPITGKDCIDSNVIYGCEGTKNVPSIWNGFKEVK